MHWRCPPRRQGAPAQPEGEGSLEDALRLLAAATADEQDPVRLAGLADAAGVIRSAVSSLVTSTPPKARASSVQLAAAARELAAFALKDRRTWPVTTTPHSWR